MVLEATMIVVDTSDWMRNGDYPPTRFQAQSDAVNLLAGAKTQDNPENAVGVLSIGGLRPRVLVALTQELGHVLTAMSQLSMEGDGVNFSKGLQMATLALKHRQNKNQRQRIVLFCGSPLDESDEDLLSLAKKLKKNSVAVDVVDMAAEPAVTAKLEAFVAAVNSNDNSHIVSVESGPSILSDVLLSSPIFSSEDGAGGSGFAAAAAASAAAAQQGASGDGGALDEFGVDPNLDPELALALRVSMEEERARQQASREAGGGGGDEAGPAPGGGGGGGGDAPPPLAGVAEDVEMMENVTMMDEDALLQQALAMSMGKTEEASTPATATTATTPGTAEAEAIDDPELAMALEMSRKAAGKEEEEAGGGDTAMADPAYVAGVLGSLPGVDPNDPAVLAALANFQNAQEEDKKEGEEKKE